MFFMEGTAEKTACWRFDHMVMMSRTLLPPAWTVKESVLVQQGKRRSCGIPGAKHSFEKAPMQLLTFCSYIYINSPYIASVAQGGQD